MPKKERKTRLWHVDPSLFQPVRKAGFLERHVIDRARAFAKYGLYMLAFAYPVILVSLGLVFGGLVFWASLAGSMGLIGLVIKKTGYAPNFAGWDVGNKKFIGLALGFCVTLLFYSSILYLKTLAFPVIAAAFAATLIFGMRRITSK